MNNSRSGHADHAADDDGRSGARVAAYSERRIQEFPGVLDTLDSGVAVLDAGGTIAAADAAWLEMCRMCGFPPATCGPGASYFRLARSMSGADEDTWTHVRDGISAVLDGVTPVFEHELEVDRQGQRCWLRVRVVPLAGDDRYTVVTHEDVSREKLAEESWVAADRHYRSLLAQVPGTVYIAAPDDPANVLFQHSGRYTYLGYPDEDWRENPSLWADLIHPDDREMVLESDRVAIETGDPYTLEYRMISSTGDIVWVHDKASLVRDETGEPLHWLGLSLNITEFKNIELALQASQEQFRSAFDEAPVGISIATVDDRYVDTNRAWCEMLGVTSQDLAEESVMERVHPDDLEGVKADRDAVVSGDVPHLYAERRMLRSDGEVIHALFGMSMIRGVDGQPYILTQSLDITERKFAEAELQETTEMLEAILRSSPIAILVTDLEHKVVEWNPTAEKLFGWSAGEVLGKPSLTIPPDADGEASDARDRVLAGEAIMNLEVKRLHKDGSLIDVSLSGAPIRDADGQVCGAMAMFLDNRHRKAVEAARAKRDRVLGMVSGGSSLDEVLDLLCELVEVEIDRSMASVLLLDGDGRFRRGGAGSLPAGFINAVNGVVAAPTMGSCGAAVHRREPVIVSDIANDPLWAEYRDFALSHGLRSCWSTPIVSDSGQVLGTFGVYSGSVRLPDEAELESLLGAGHMARIAIERKLADERLRESEQLFRGAFENAATGLALIAFDGTFLRVNRTVCEMLGYDESELIGMNYLDVTHPDDMALIDTVADLAVQDPDQAIEIEKRYVHRDGHTVWAGLASSLVRDGDDNPLYYITQMHDITPRKQAVEAMKQSEERFRGLIQHASDMIVIVDEDLRMIYVSPAVERVLGWSPEELVGRNIAEILISEDLEKIMVILPQLTAEAGKHLPLVYRCIHKDGTTRWVEATATNLLHVPGLEGFVVNARDITERLEADQQLRESEERFRSAFEDASVAMAILAPDGTILRVNQAMCDLTGYDAHEIIGQSGSSFNHPDEPTPDPQHVVRLLTGEITSFQSERRYIHRDGSTIWALVNLAAAHDADGNPANLIAQIQDITGRKKLEESLHHQAYHDTLTGLPNRALLLERLRLALDLYAETRTQAALIYLDLDNFKVVNDSLGHAAGDDLLIQIADRLHDSVRPGDTVARLGGDEFAILLRTSASPNQALDDANRIAQVLDWPFPLGGRSVTVSASIGVVLANEQSTPDDLLRQADVAMYRAKARGRNRIEMFDSEMQAEALHRLEMEHDLRTAISANQFEVHYQPVVNVRTGAVAGLEALVRWNHPQRGILLPGEFISIAEDAGLIVRIGKMVLHEACRQGREWIAAGLLGPDATIGVNLSARQFSQPDLVDDVTRVLAVTGLEPRQLVLEVTETVLMDDVDDAVQRLDMLSELGVRIAVDDFGTGYSSLAYLRRFPVDLLKIDRSFISKLLVSTTDAAIVNAIVSLAQSLGIKSVAEGVETDEQFTYLKNLGCDRAQGYLISHALPTPLVADVLRRVTP